MFITYKELEDHEGWDRPSINERLGQEPRGGFAPWAKRTIPPEPPRPAGTSQTGNTGADSTPTRLTSDNTTRGEER